jgi:hypothetical protein
MSRKKYISGAGAIPTPTHFFKSLLRYRNKAVNKIVSRHILTGGGYGDFDMHVIPLVY